ALSGGRRDLVEVVDCIASILSAASCPAFVSFRRSGHLTCSTRRLPRVRRGTTLGETASSRCLWRRWERRTSQSKRPPHSARRRRDATGSGQDSPLFWLSPNACKRLVLLSVFTSRR